MITIACLLSSAFCVINSSLVYLCMDNMTEKTPRLISMPTAIVGGLSVVLALAPFSWRGFSVPPALLALEAAAFAVLLALYLSTRCSFKADERDRFGLSSAALSDHLQQQAQKSGRFH